MPDPCTFCSKENSNTYCMTCYSLFCSDCAYLHISSIDSSHQLINYQLFLEQNETKANIKKETMKNVSSWLKDRLIQANLDIDQQCSDSILSIQGKRAALHTLVDKIYEEKLLEQKEAADVNQKALELMSKSKTLVNRQIITQHDVDSLVFSEIFTPGISHELEQAIHKELSYNIEVYPTSKPISLYSFKANSSQVFMFDVLSEEEVIMNVKNFECKSYAGWCMVGPNIIYTGGWKQGYSSFEVFEVNVTKWIVQPHPHLLNPRHQHGVQYADEAVFVFGGAGKAGLLTACEKWRLSEDSWRSICSLPNPITQMGICTVGKFIYISGGAEFERYSISKDCFFRLSARFEGRVLSTLVPWDSDVLIFRPGELWQYECETALIFKITDLEYIDLWSSTHPVVRLGKIFFFIEGLRIVYSYDVYKKKLEFVTDFRKSDESFEG